MRYEERDGAPGRRRILKKRVSVSFPELVLVAATRGALGIGAGLLLAGKLPAKQRRALGSVLFVVGALSTIPIALRLFRRPDGAVAQRAARHQLSRTPSWLEAR
jgi:hypothetical protein